MPRRFFYFCNSACSWNAKFVLGCARFASRFISNRTGKTQPRTFSNFIEYDNCYWNERNSCVLPALPLQTKWKTFLSLSLSYSPRWFFLPASRTAGGRKNPNQVQCRTLVGIIWKEDFFRCTKLLLRSASCSPRCSSPCCFRHRRRTGMNLTKYVLWLEQR